jgi:glycosidase
VRDIGVDGFRMDVAWGVKGRRPDFWPRWRREMKRINPDLFLLAEASGVDPYYFANGFDVAYDWTRSLGQWAWSSGFDFPQEAGPLLRERDHERRKGLLRRRGDPALHQQQRHGYSFRRPARGGSERGVMR